MRPKPLIPTLIFAISEPFSSSVSASSLTGQVREESALFRSAVVSVAWTAGGPGSSEDDPPGPSPARDLTADGV